MINVLIVEDDPMVAELNKQYLEMMTDFKLIAIAKNGQQALELLATNNIQLILLDVYMPQMDGLTLLENIRNKFTNIEVIMITAACSSDNIQAALNLGIIDYLVKPFTFDRFKMALLTCQEKINILSENKEFNQLELDQLIFNSKNATCLNNKLPKGIDPDTLKKVESILKMNDKEFSVNDIVDTIELSRISLKKYIDFLHNERAVLTSRLEYLSVGRPVRIYKYKTK